MSSFANSKRQQYGAANRGGSKVQIASQDESQYRDTKFEGYSDLRSGHEKAKKKERKNADNKTADELEQEMILNLQRQIATMETEIKLLKEKEVDQKNRASGYETLLRDRIPLNEHILALKTKYNNEQDGMKLTMQALEDENNRELKQNQMKRHKIDISRTENQNMSQKFKYYKEKQRQHFEDLEAELYEQTHTRNTFDIERDEANQKLQALKLENDKNYREIKQSKTFNKRDDVIKEQKKALAELQELVADQRKLIIELTVANQRETIRLNDKNLLKKQQVRTNELKKDANKAHIDLSIAKSRINELENQREALSQQIFETFTEKRKYDKENMDMEAIVLGHGGANSEDDQKAKLFDLQKEQTLRLQSSKDFLRKEMDKLMEQLNSEEDQAKKFLNIKMDLEQTLALVNEDLTDEKSKQELNRDLLINLKRNLSKLDNMKARLTDDVKEIKEANVNLIKSNEDYVKENEKLDVDIKVVRKSININNLLKEIDADELLMQAEHNKQRNAHLINLVDRWENIQNDDTMFQASTMVTTTKTTRVRK